MAVTDRPIEVLASCPARVSRTTLGAYVALTKPRIMSLLLFTTLAALLMAQREYPVSGSRFIVVLVCTLIGGAMASGGAAALNCYIDRDIDELMARTKRRAIPAGTLTPTQALYFGLTLSAASVALLALTTNMLAAGLALLGNVFYVVIYTLWLKRATTQNIVIGGIAGAIPPLVGWAAITDSLALPAILLTVIITYWTPAHFWALALLVRRDYNRARVPMLPAVTSERHAQWQILVYALLVVIASLLLFAVHAMGVIYLIAAIALGGGFVYHAVSLREHGSARQARRTFMYSNYYLAALFAFMIVDRIIGL
ncbi:MAG: heme o synthase [Chloroflexota bacterium]